MISLWLPLVLPWMLAAAAFSALLAVAAFAAEKGLRALRLPTRHAWSAALVAATLWPVIAIGVRSRPVEVASAGIVELGEVIAGDVVAAPAAPIDWNDVLPVALLLLWVLLSTLLLLRLARHTLFIRDRVRTMRVQRFDGERVLVSDSIGPAAIGVWDGDVVVPRWFGDLDVTLRQPVLRHEREHVRAGDPFVLWSASVLVALVPWNPAVWWIAHRLRLAIEVDCDARTLVGATRDERLRYARVLMLIAQRNGAASYAPMLVHSPSQLARRISEMNALPTRPLPRVVGAVTVLAAALGVACTSAVHNNFIGPARSEVAEGSLTPPDAESATQPVDTTRNLPAVVRPGQKGPGYTRDLRMDRITGSVITQFVVGVDGKADMGSLRILFSSHARLTENVLANLPTMQFLPALVKGRKVRQLVQMPFRFELDGVAMQDLPPRVVAVTEGSDVRLLPVWRAIATPLPQSDSAPTFVQPGTAFFDYQVEQPVVMAPGSRGPAYPAALREKGVEGTVLAQFIVDVDGRAEVGTFKVLKSSSPEFADAVREAIASMRFIPAKVGGKAVRQVLQQPFQFSLNR